MSKAKVATKESKNSIKEVTHEEAKLYLKKLDNAVFINDEEEEDSDEMDIPEGDHVYINQVFAQLGFDSDNDDTIIRGDAENDSGNGATLSETIHDTPDFGDSDDEYENIVALQNRYRAERKSKA
jgi:hypothetical protein